MCRRCAAGYNPSAHKNVWTGREPAGRADWLRAGYAPFARVEFEDGENFKQARKRIKAEQRAKYIEYVPAYSIEGGEAKKGGSFFFVYRRAPEQAARFASLLSEFDREADRLTGKITYANGCYAMHRAFAALEAERE